MRVRSVLILLRPEADSPRLTGVYRLAFPGEAPYLEFRYRVVRAWEVPVERFLGGGLGVLPLAPLADLPEEALPGVIRRMQERLRREATLEVAEVLWTATYVLMGLRYADAVAARLLEGVIAMEDSVTYQAIIRKGAARGALDEVKKVLLRQGTRKFGSPTAETTAALQAIPDLPRLERMVDRMFDAISWDDLLATP